MNRLAPARAALLLCLLAAPASATTVDLVDGMGALDWDTSVSVTDPAPNTSVTHPLFPYNRHPHEGWFLYVENFGTLHEFTSFTKTTDGASQDVITSSITTGFGDPITLELTYGITAVGPDGLPDLAWSGTVSRPYSPTSLFPTLDVRLFSVWDYDVGADPFSDVATVTTPTGPDVTLVEIEGSGGITGFRGVVDHVLYTVDTRANVLSQIQVGHLLNGTAAPGAYDVAGAFQWSSTLCSGQDVPECPDFVGIGGSSAIGGFGGFGPYGGDPLPEPSAAALWLGGLGLLVAHAHPRRARRAAIARSRQRHSESR